jgi:TonB family protein
MSRDPLAELAESRRREGYGPLAVGLALAIALHLLLLPTFTWVLGDSGHGKQLKNNRAGYVQLSRADWEKNKRIQIDVKGVDPKKRDDEKKKKKDDDEEVEAPGQVVTLPRPKKEERPDLADYAAEYDQKTDRETRSRDQRQHAPAVANRLVQGLPGESLFAEKHDGQSTASTSDRSAGPDGRGRSKAGDSGTDPDDGAGTRMYALEIPKQAAREKLELKFDKDGIFENRSRIPELPGQGDEARVAIGPQKMDAARKPGNGTTGNNAGQGLRGGGNGTEGLPSLAQLTPSSDKLASLAGAPANDYLPEVEVDAETRLNAWRWKHATFFNRVADAIRREWQGGEVLQQNDPVGQVYGFEERMTVVQVTLDRSGNVLDVNVSSPSGANPLDDEAVRAFKEAGPFSNPPPQLFKGGDRFTFSFGFNVSYNRSNFDLKWRPD